VRQLKLPVLLVLPWMLVAGPVSGQGSPAPNQVTELVVVLTNEFRAQEGRKRVEMNARLTSAARYFAGHMAETGKFAHDADGSAPESRATQHGYDYCIVSENIAYRYSSAGFATRELAQGFVEGWKNSPGHRKNMLDPDVTETGAAVARGSRTGYYYAVQMFGRPTTQAIKVSIANRSNVAIPYRLGSRSYTLAPRQTRTHQQCRSDELRFDWPGGQRDTTISPKDGDRYSIGRTDAGGFSLKPE
jgi:hypothetical protein